jgi:hypothetical protein
MPSDHPIPLTDRRAATPVRINGPAGDFEATLPAPPGVTILSLRMEAGQRGDPFRRWAVDDCAALLEALQELVRVGGTAPNIAVVVACEPTADPWEQAAMDAALEAVRGAVHSLTPELGAAARLNIIACRPKGNHDGVAAALGYVASPGGAYVAGSTFDLREAS